MKSGPGSYRALVLAGRRGQRDALAEHAGVSHRVVLPVADTPMIARVIDTLARTERIANVTVSIDEPAVLDDVEELRPHFASGFLALCTSAATPATSVAAFLGAIGSEDPVLVTTADHPLLTPEIVSAFLEQAEVLATDVAVGVVTEEVFRRDYPDLERTFIRLGPDAFSGANLFLFRGRRAAAAAMFWVRAEHLRKTPWRLVGVFGLAAVLRFLVGRLDADSALERAATRIGASVRLVRLPFAEAAIDVDRPSDLAVAHRLLGKPRGPGIGAVSRSGGMTT